MKGAKGIVGDKGDRGNLGNKGMQGDNGRTSNVPVSDTKNSDPSASDLSVCSACALKEILSNPRTILQVSSDWLPERSLSMSTPGSWGGLRYSTTEGQASEKDDPQNNNNLTMAE